MLKLMERARDYGKRVGTATQSLDMNSANQYWQEYVCWYHALLDAGQLTRKEFEDIDAAYREGKRDDSVDA